MSFFNPIYDSSYQAHLHSLEEPDATVLRGSGRRYEPLSTPTQDWNKLRSEFILEHGQAAWEAKCREYAEWEKGNFNL